MFIAAIPNGGADINERVTLENKEKEEQRLFLLALILGSALIKRSVRQPVSGICLLSRTPLNYISCVRTISTYYSGSQYKTHRKVPGDQKSCKKQL